MTRRSLAAMPLCVVLAGCASASRQPAPPPEAAVLFDEPQALAILEAARDSMGVEAPITYAVTTTPDLGVTLVPVASGLGTHAAEDLASRLLEVSTDKLRQYGDRIAIDISLEEPIRIAARTAEFRPARQLNAGDIGREFTELRGQVPDGTKVTLWLHVEETGAVTETRVTRRSGNPSYDQMIQRVAASSHYAPCTMDGVPIGCWIERTIQTRRRTN